MFFKHSIKYYNSLDSTNEEAKREISASGNSKILFEDNLQVIFSDSQTKGKGRLGRTWQSFPGNFYCSFIISPVLEMKRWHELSFIMAVSAGETIRDILLSSGNSIKPEYKWPNDILVDKKKISGILLETFSNDNQKYLILGCGINISDYPKDNISYEATCLREYGSDYSAKKIMGILIEKFDKYYCKSKNEGFKSIINIWLESAKGLNESISVTGITNDKTEGVFEGLEDNGFLRLRKDNGEISLISAGDIFFTKE